MNEHEVRQKIYSLKLKHASKLTLLAILSRVSWDNWVGQVSANDISLLMNIPIRTVKSALSDLTAQGYIERSAQLRSPAQHHRAQTKLIISEVCKNCTGAKTALVQKLHPPSAKTAPPLVQELHPPSAKTAPPLVQELHPITIEESIEVSIEENQYSSRAPQAAPQPQQHNQSQPLRVYVPTMEERERVLRESLERSNAEYEARLAHLSPERRRHEEIMMRAQNLKTETYK